MLLGCGVYTPEKIHYGADQCDYCKMTIADEKFGSELITRKGRVYKYDSIECLAAASRDFAAKHEDIHSSWLTDFGRPGEFLDASKAWIVLTERQQSPMGLGLVAVSTEDLALNLIDEVGGLVVSWTEVTEIVKHEWNLD